MRLRPKLAGHSFRPRLPRRTIRVRLAVLFFARLPRVRRRAVGGHRRGVAGQNGGVNIQPPAPAGSLLHPADRRSRSTLPIAISC